jgi:hypothetical protein
MPSHQKNHYVPEAYFKPWCNFDDGKLTCFHWEGGRFLVNRANPRSIANERLLYALNGAPAEHHVALETNYFTPHVDEPGAVVLQAIIANGVSALTREQRHLLVRYLMALRARTPENIAKIKDVGKEMLQQELRRDPHEYAAIKYFGAPDSLEDCIASWYREGIGLVTLPEIIDHPETHNELAEMQWWCFDFRDANVELLTCDRPLIWHGGVKEKQFFLALPITPRLGLFITKDAQTENKLRNIGATALARKFNESVIASAAKYVYAVHDGAFRFIKTRLAQ